MTAVTAASVRARLLSRAKGTGTEFELFLVRYACERFLYRLGRSDVRDRCILKSASLLALWMAEPFLGTRDVDLLSLGGRTIEATVGEVMTTIRGVPCPLAIGSRHPSSPQPPSPVVTLESPMTANRPPMSSIAIPDRS